MNRVTLGGNRLGAGNQMKVNLSQYPRSTFNLSRQWRSTMAAGLLVPCFKDIVLPGDTWDIKMQAKIFTIPTIGPVFGSCKLQVDFFFAPFRLYNGALHNNAIGIGLKMDTIKMPKLETGTISAVNVKSYINPYESVINQSTLNAYLGVRDIQFAESQNAGYEGFGGFHMMYYDIFKNSYANKQENNAYVMGVKQQEPQVYMEFIKLLTGEIIRPRLIGNTPQQMAYGLVAYNAITGGTPVQQLVIEGEDLDPRGITLDVVTKSGNQPDAQWTNRRTITLSDIIIAGSEQYNSDKSQLIVTIAPNNSNLTANEGNTQRMLWWLDIGQKVIAESQISKLMAFPLTNIDDARRLILSNNTGAAVTISRQTDNGMRLNKLPYLANVNRYKETYGNQQVDQLWAKKPLVGLMAKTYQADVFNAWLNSEFVDQITANTSVTITNGKLEMNSLLMAEKLFNLQTDITIAGGTYKDWRKAMWGVEATSGIETPIYLGGYSSEIIFDEVVANANSQNADGKDIPTGSLAGKGSLFADAAKGGRVRFKAKEEGMLMGIVSITPRIDYCQGNAWFFKAITHMQDLHTPALDRIGFQDLLMQTQLGSAGLRFQSGAINDPATGKVPAWIFYQTAFNEVYGEFATNQSQNFMVFTRDYEPMLDGNVMKIMDNTTYINPKKTNKVFADASETGQNFWVQLGFKVNTRRKMSSNPIPRF